MLAIDPSAMMFTSVLVSVVTMLVLLLSPAGAEQRESIWLWVAGDVLGIATRLLTLTLPAALGMTQNSMPVPRGQEAVNAALIVGAAVLHALALRSTLGQPARRRTLLVALGAAACCALLTACLADPVRTCWVDGAARSSCS